MGVLIVSKGSAVVSTPTPVPTSPVVLPAGARYARDVRNGLGLNVPFGTEPPARTAKLLADTGIRVARMQFSGDNRGAMTGLQDALVAGGYPDPNLRLQVLLNGYINNAAANTLTNQEGWLVSLAAKRGPNGKRILWACEGINECTNAYVGNGSRGPNDQINKTGQAPGGPMGVADNPVGYANFMDWVNETYALRARHPELADMLLFSPTIVDFQGKNYSSSLNSTGKVDFGTFHYYAGAQNGFGGVPSPAGNPGNLSRTYDYAQAGIFPGGQMVMSEGGASTEAGTGGYGLEAQAKCLLLSACDFFAKGGFVYNFYNAFNDPESVQGSETSYNENNFGIAYADGQLKFAATAIRRWQNLLSLGLDADNPANFNDTALFTPGYDPAAFSVTGVSPIGTAGGSLVMPKSDGSTVAAVWNQPAINANGQSITPAVNNAVAHLGASRTWTVYDPLTGMAPIASGTGTDVPLALRGSPLLIQIAA